MHADIPGNFALLGAVLMAVNGLLFLLAPARGLAITQHRAEQLPTIMAGRYFAMAGVIVWAALYADARTLMGLFIGLALVAVFDALTYLRAKSNPWPHIGAGLGALLVAGLAYWQRGA